MILVFRTVTPDGDTEYWATNDLNLMPEQREVVGRQCWAIESYQRGLKQCCGVERAHVRKAVAQHNHILLAVRAFVRLEVHRLRRGLRWYAAKLGIIRDAIRAYVARPTIRLHATA